jgi:hypothetical protein
VTIFWSVTRGFYGSQFNRSAEKHLQKYSIQVIMRLEMHKKTNLSLGCSTQYVTQISVVVDGAELVLWRLSAPIMDFTPNFPRLGPSGGRQGGSKWPSAGLIPGPFGLYEQGLVSMGFLTNE